MIDREKVYEALTRENDYAMGFGGPEHDARFSYMDWIAFARRYLQQAEDGYTGFCPDDRAIRQRLVKAASLLVTALQHHCKSEEELNLIAGVSSEQFPVDDSPAALEPYRRHLAEGKPILD
ncbi:MAG TPA: hypothetical protein VD862_03550 [Candidatus Paceibacterota bacterium]|nr:hypothetical protein [Candidatus Paceibacterota bacterium]